MDLLKGMIEKIQLPLLTREDILNYFIDLLSRMQLSRNTLDQYHQDIGVKASEVQ